MLSGIVYILLSFLFFPPKETLPRKENISNGCLECHQKIINKAYVHPGIDSTCFRCHIQSGNRHPSEGLKGFKLASPVAGLCYDCHAEMKINSDSLKVVHGPMKDTKSCTNCHDPHSSDAERLLKKESIKLCLDCHKKSINTGNIILKNINQIIQGSKSVHPVLENGGCTICHNPHFSDRKLMLAGAFPAGIYSKGIPENYELCFMCHDSDLMNSEKTKSATNFRNGDQNLHFVHINGDKGHSCQVCHNVHAAPNEKLIENSIQFGQWSMNLNYKINENGGSCSTGCHGLKEYNREPQSSVAGYKTKEKEN